MEHLLVLVLVALVCFVAGFGVGRVSKRAVVVPKPVKSGVQAHPKPFEPANSPFVLCRFLTQDGRVVAEKRLRRESVTTPMLWGGVPYRRIAHSVDNSRFTFERE